MKHLSFLALTLSFALIFSAATAQTKRYIDLKVTLDTPYNGQKFMLNDTVYMDAVIQNLGPDTLRTTDSIAVYAISSDGNLEVLIDGSPYFHVYGNRKLAVGDTMHIYRPFYKAGSKKLCIVVTPYTDSLNSIWYGVANLLDTVYDNSTDCITLQIEPGTSVGQLSAGKLRVTSYPNPAASNVYFEINTPENATVKINILDITGRVVRASQYPALTQGEHTISMPTDGLADGMYIYRVEAADYSATGKINIAQSH